MTPIVKTGIIASLITVPTIAVSSLRVGSGAKSLSELSETEITKKEEPITHKPKPIPNTINNVRAKLTATGYSQKSEDKLADFNYGRSTNPGGNFALGCHKLLFGGRDIKRVHEVQVQTSDYWVYGDPMDGYLGSNNEPVLGCSTASVMKWEQEYVYEFELAVRRGDGGFLERITAWKDGKKAVSQLTIYKRDGKDRPWGTWYAVQRKDTNVGTLEMGNPVEKRWSDLEIKQEEEKKTKYFTVWVDAPSGQTKSPQDKNMLENLGVRFKGQQKIFSSLAKAKHENEWTFKFFGSVRNKIPLELSTTTNTGKNKATYNSKIAEDVARFKGEWKDVKNFCQDQETKAGELSNADIERLRDYCYTKKNS